MRSGKRKHLYGRPRATVSIATPLQWEMTSLVQSLNLIRAQKSITSVGLNMFFFSSIGEARATFLDRWNRLQFCFSNFKVMLSFFKSLHLSPLNSSNSVTRVNDSTRVAIFSGSDSTQVTLRKMVNRLDSVPLKVRDSESLKKSHTIFRPATIDLSYSCVQWSRTLKTSPSGAVSAHSWMLWNAW